MQQVRPSGNARKRLIIDANRRLGGSLALPVTSCVRRGTRRRRIATRREVRSPAPFQAAKRRNAALMPIFREAAKVAERAKSANDILLAFLIDASVITRGPDDLRSAFCQRSRALSSTVGRRE
jgi:hypothetical protein